MATHTHLEMGHNVIALSEGSKTDPSVTSNEIRGSRSLPCESVYNGGVRDGSINFVFALHLEIAKGRHPCP